jgi:hypothetical protein
MAQKIIPKIKGNLSIGLVDPAIVEVKIRDGRILFKRVDIGINRF